MVRIPAYPCRTVALQLKQLKGVINIPSLECYAVVGKIARQDFFTNVKTNTPNLINFQFNNYFFKNILINLPTILRLVSVAGAG